MKKALLVIIIVLLTIIPQTNALPKSELDVVKRSFSCSIEISGGVQTIKPFVHITIREKSFIMYCSIQFNNNSNIKVTIDDEVFIFDTAGKIQIIGFRGTYNEEIRYDKTYIDLNGKAMYVKIKVKTHSVDDDYYLPIINSLNNITHPLTKSPLELTDQDLESLSCLSDCEIVGLGEATHGTKEFFELKHRIFKYLVEKHDFKIFAFECDMGESYFVDNFVTKGEGDIDDIMINKMHFWTWRTQEVKELLLWMMEYNSEKLDENKIHFIGVDCQYMTHQSEIIINYFNKTNITLPEEHLQFLNEINEIGSNLRDYYLNNVTLEKKEEINYNVDNLITKLEDLKDELINASSEYEYQFIKQIALNIKQANEMHYGSIHDNQKNYRDMYMAQNTLWTKGLFGENTKVALWAHNWHVSNINSSYSPMGYHLKEELQDKYQILGFAFSLGNFTAVSINKGLGTCQIKEEPKFGSINYVFHHAEDKNFILRESDIPVNSSFDIWISKPQMFLDIGSVFFENSYDHYKLKELKEENDFLIYWNTTTASELLQV